ncbi:MAG: ABC transporter permease [Chloroflexi bacterium]|nr:ABC transporter permease [Chloroflexota bacterium]MBV9894271.1 ABC transporter permease [Chloroflexota bacterium]
MARPAHPVGLSGPVARDARLPFRTRPSSLERSMDAVQHMDPAALFGFAIIMLFVLAALLAPLIEPRDPLAQDLASRLKPPGFTDPQSGTRLWLGTDGLGRDILSRLIEGARVSLLVGACGASLSAVLGTSIGLSAGYLGGWFDAAMMRIVDVWQAVPYTILAIAIAVILGPSLQNVILVLGISSWVNYARVVRSETLSQRHGEVVLAARVVGAGHLRIVLRHVLPQVAASIVVLSSLMVGSMILFEASLSFLGLGVQPPTPSWGNMVLDGVEPIRVAWWVSLFPGLAILLVVMAINILGDWLRDRLDPRHSML